MAYVNVDVDIDLDQFSDDELLKEMKLRGFEVVSTPQTTSLDEDLEQIYLVRRQGLSYDYLIDAYIYKMLGRVI